MTLYDKTFLEEATEEWSNPREEEQKEWLSPKETYAHSGISISTLNKWRGKRINLNFYQMGKFIKYKRAEVDMFIISNKIEVA